MFMLYPNIGDNAETRNRSALLFCDDFDTAGILKTELEKRLNVSHSAFLRDIVLNAETFETVAPGVYVRFETSAKSNRSALVEIVLSILSWFSADPFIPLRSVRVVFENPAHNYTTTINGTRAEIIRYFVGARLCVCADPETLATVRGVEFLESGVSDDIL